MELGRLFYGSNLWVIAGCVLGVLLLAAEAGWRFGRRSEDEKLHGHVAGITAATLGLLGLLLAFTFSMSSARYDHRKQLILNEANAIGTAWLRAGLLNEPLRGGLQKTLSEYAGSRIALYDAGLDALRFTAAVERSEALQRLMWGLVARVAREDARPGVVFGVMEAMNEVFDLHEARVAALENYVPAGLILMLITVAALSLSLVGWTAGLAGRRSHAATVLFAVLVTVVLGVIMDLNRPQRGLMRTGQNSMLRLQKSLNGEASATAHR